MFTCLLGYWWQIVLAKKVVQRFLEKILHGFVLIKGKLFDLPRYFWAKETCYRLFPSRDGGTPLSECGLAFSDG
jgi:hypothetical protein